MYVSNELADSVICSGTSGIKSDSKSFFNSSSISESPIVYDSPASCLSITERRSEMVLINEYCPLESASCINLEYFIFNFEYEFISKLFLCFNLSSISSSGSSLMNLDVAFIGAKIYNNSFALVIAT